MLVRTRTLIFSALAIVLAFGLVAPPSILAAVPEPAAASLPSQQFAQPVVIVNTSYLHFRSGPGAMYSVIGILSGGTSLPVVGRNRDDSWWQVQTAAGVGWVSAEFVLPRGDFTPIPVIPDPGVVETALGVVPGSPVNVYALPSTASGLLGLALGGSELPITGRTIDGAWWQVQTNVGSGYVLQSDVLLRGNAASVPIISTTSVASQPVSLAPVMPSGQGGGSMPGGTVAVYAQASVASGVVASIPAGTSLTIIGRTADNSYLQITGSFGSGWVVASSVSIAGDLNAVPVTAGAAPAAVAAVVPGQGGGSFPVTSFSGGGGGEQAALISVERAEVKELPEEGSPTLDYVDRLDTVYIQNYSDPGDFARVRYNDIHYGWVAVDEMAIVNAGDTRYQVAFTGFGLLGVRNAPDFNATTIFLLPTGEIMAVIGYSGAGWVQIEHPLGIGWVESSAVEGVPGTGGGSSAPTGWASAPSYVAVASVPVGSGGAVVATAYQPAAQVIPVSAQVQLPVAAAAPAQIELPRVIINTGAVNIRSGPGGQYTSLATVAGGTELFAIAVTPDTEWYQIQAANGATGWVDSEFVIFRGDFNVLPIIDYDQISSGAVSLPEAIVSSPVNVYLAPNVAAGLLGTASAGVNLPVVGRTADFNWLQVQTSAGFGWVLSSTVTFRGDANIVPIIQ